MSVQTVRDFWQKANQDSALQKKLSATQSIAKDAAIADVIRIAAAAGFSFTQAEYETAVKEELARQHAAGDLNDESLAAIAGGQYTQSCGSASGGVSKMQ
jgi:predicted ribosomally synthesized peptide with nif11-like leader